MLRKVVGLWGLKVIVTHRYFSRKRKERTPLWLVLYCFLPAISRNLHQAISPPSIFRCAIATRQLLGPISHLFWEQCAPPTVTSVLQFFGLRRLIYAFADVLISDSISCVLNMQHILSEKCAWRCRSAYPQLLLNISISTYICADLSYKRRYVLVWAPQFSLLYNSTIKALRG